MPRLRTRLSSSAPTNDFSNRHRLWLARPCCKAEVVDDRVLGAGAISRYHPSRHGYIRKGVRAGAPACRRQPAQRLDRGGERVRGGVGTKGARPRYGPSGTLKDEIAGGTRAEVFASANMEHPQALAAAGKSGPVVLFARNRLCALVRPGLAVEPATLLDRMLDSNVKLGASTPRADPSGDYAWEMFRKADKVKPGAFEALEKKALQLTGGPERADGPAGTHDLWSAGRRRQSRHLSHLLHRCARGAEAKCRPADRCPARRARGGRRLRVDGGDPRVTAGLSIRHVHLVAERSACAGKVWLRSSPAAAIGERHEDRCPRRRLGLTPHEASIAAH